MGLVDMICIEPLLETLMVSKNGIALQDLNEVTE